MQDCPGSIYWFDLGCVMGCLLAVGHPGDHCDGLRFFDDDQLWRPRDPLSLLERYELVARWHREQSRQLPPPHRRRPRRGRQAAAR